MLLYAVSLQYMKDSACQLMQQSNMTFQKIASLPNTVHLPESSLSSSVLPCLPSTL